MCRPGRTAGMVETRIPHDNLGTFDWYAIRVEGKRAEIERARHKARSLDPTAGTRLPRHEFADALLLFAAGFLLVAGIG
jgi:hypothetical protein